LMEKEAEGKKLRFKRRIWKILALTREESEAPVTYYVLDKICDALALSTPPIKKVMEALREKGFQAFPTHFNPRGIRSNASAKAIKEIVSAFYKDKI